MGTWEVILSATASGLQNGGTGGMIWMFVGSFLCFSTIVLSLAEMSSMAPTAGGQYHWASEFSPPQYQRFVSYMAGWLSTLSWQCGTCSGMFLLGTQVQGLIAITHDGYERETWQGYLLVILMAGLGLLLNTWGAKQLPLIEGVILVLHVFGWATVLIVLWILSPKNDTLDVFTSFENNGGWSSMGLSMLVGQVTAIYGLIGSDGAAHMAEETKDASIIVPRCMIWSYLLNGSMGFVMLVTYCFCLTDVEAALNSASGFPYIYVFQSGTGSTGGAVGLTSVIIVLGLAVSIWICLSGAFEFRADFATGRHLLLRIDKSSDVCFRPRQGPSGLSVDRCGAPQAHDPPQRHLGHFCVYTPAQSDQPGVDLCFVGFTK